MIAARPSLVTDAHGPRGFALELSDQPTDGVRFVRELPRHRRRVIPNQHRNEQILLMRIDSNVRSNLLHDRLLSSAALAPRGVNPRSRWHTPPCRERQHYDVTIAGR